MLSGAIGAMKQRSCAASIKSFALFYGAGEQIKRVSDVAVKEQDLKTDQKEVGRLVHLQGYAYLNALFFARHRRHW